MMKVLMFWQNMGVHDAYRMLCIRRVTEVYPSAEFIAITDFPEFFPECFQILDLDIVINELMCTYTDKQDHIDMQSHYVFVSDYARMHFLSIHPNTLYLDTDTYCAKKMPEFPLGFVGSRKNPCNNDVIYNNDRPDIIKDLMERRHMFRPKPNLVPLMSLLQWDVNAINLSNFFAHKWQHTVRKEVEQMLKGKDYGSNIYRGKRFGERPRARNSHSNFSLYR